MNKTRRVPQRARAIRRLAKLREIFGPDAAAKRERLLRACGRARCRSGKELSSLHETLCFARAYPDNQAVLDLVQGLLDRWERRADVRALGEALQGLGMAGVANAYPFFWPTARWLAERWPGALHVDWDNLEDADGVASLLKLLMPRAESPALEELPLTARQWVRHLKRDDEGDGTFLVRRFAEASMDERWREEVFDSLDVPFVLAPARGTPSRTTSFIAGLPLCWQTHARSTARPDLKREIERPPKRMRHVNHKRGAELVDAARVAMLTRERDLEQIAYAYPGDAWILEDEDGLCFVALGKVPERRFVPARLAGIHPEVVQAAIATRWREPHVDKPTHREFLTTICHVLAAEDAERKHFLRSKLGAESGVEIASRRRCKRIRITALHVVAHPNDF